MSNALIEQFTRDGYAIVDDLFTSSEVEVMKKRAYELASKDPPKDDEKFTVFSTDKENQLKTDTFLNSNDKVHIFYEEKALDENGKLVVKPPQGVNKIGHALHYLDPTFREFTYCDRMKCVVKMLGFKEPAVAQSMVIFKNPDVSSIVAPHQDGTYLYTEPTPVTGFWIALEDTTVSNGCLWAMKGSHKSGIHRRLMRNPDPISTEKLIYDKPAPTYDASAFVPLLISAGSCIILHGNVVHKSSVNKTQNPRPAYTFHVIEKKDNTYAPENWLQEGPNAPFANMFQMNPTDTSNSE